MVSTSSQDAQREARRRKGGPSKSVRDLGWDPLRPDGLEQQPFSGEFRNGFKAFLGFNKQFYNVYLLKFERPKTRPKPTQEVDSWKGVCPYFKENLAR